jgi:hypothetical protein
MKKLLVLSLALTSVQVFGLTLGDLVGKYSVTSDLIPVNNIITIDKKGAVTLVENSVHGAMSCTGNSTFAANKISSKMTCANGASFEQSINLSKVTNLNSFQAPVYSTLFGQEIVMKFTKIK